MFRRFLLSLGLLCCIAVRAQNLSPAFTYSVHSAKTDTTFDIALTPSGDLLDFVYSPDGQWKLVRIQNWATPHPIETSQIFTVPPQNDPARVTYGSPMLVASGHTVLAYSAVSNFKRDDRKRSEDTLATFDADTLKPLAKTVLTYASKSGAQYWLASNGNVVQTVDDDFDPTIPKPPTTLKVFDRATLKQLTSCRYVQDLLSNKPAVPVQSDCAPVLQATSATSIEALQSQQLQHFPYISDRTIDQRLGVKYGVYISPDKRFAFVKNERDDNFQPLPGGKQLVLYDVASGKKLGIAAYPQSSQLYAVFATVAGKQYLLSVENGSILRAYALSH